MSAGETTAAPETAPVPPAPAPGRRVLRYLTEPDAPLATWLLLRGLGLTYLCAYLSLFPQILGLCGARGVLPAAPFLAAVSREYGLRGVTLLPTLLWLGASDTALHLLCLGGVAASVLVILGRLERVALPLLWIFYLSLVSVGRDFLSFQWDALLLEAGFLASVLVIVAPRPARGAFPAPRIVRWLFLWLLFRLMFGAGWAKLRSGDPTWRDLTALHYHFETQPLPTLLGYYAHRAPAVLKSLGVVWMFVIENAVPFFIFVPRLRAYAFVPLVGLQAVIAATGNYGFFNLLSCVLCVPLLSEARLGQVLRLVLRGRAPAPASADAPVQFPGRLATAGLLLSGLFLGLVSTGEALTMFVRRSRIPAFVRAPMEQAEGFHLTARYGLFAVMTTTRPEIVIEGSIDGKEWRAYEFPYKPVALHHRPRLSAPHQPRIDWQLWFAALGEADENPWFRGLCIRLLQGSPDVLALLGRNPFPDRPPRYLRALRYPYRFTDARGRAQTGNYWRRGDEGEPYLGPVSLE